MLSVIDAAYYGAIAYGSSLLLKYLYRLSPLHPLYRVPGPRAAALSTLCEFYYNIVQDGQFVFKTVEWHEKYGPIIRVGPNEVHVADPNFYNTLYSKDYTYSKYGPHYRFAQQKEGGLGNTNNRTHKARRNVLDPLFSTASVMKLEPRIKKYVDLATARIGRVPPSEAFKINTVFRCLTVDIISEYAYSECIGMLEDERLNDPFFTAMDSLCRLTWFYNWTWRMQDLLMAMPLSFVKKILPPDVLGVLEFQAEAEERVIQFVADPEKAKAKHTHTTVFEVLLHGNEQKGYEVPSMRALKEEAWGFLAAGSETTAATLTSGIWEACKQPEIQEKLYAELTAAFPDPENDPITYKRALKCEYLGAFIRETMRTPPEVPGRLPRVTPKGGVKVCGQFIPEGTTIGMSAIMQHYDPKVYKDAQKFIPERWITDNIPESAFVPFGKGSRGCQGMNLAWAELYLMFASLFRTYRFEVAKESTFGDTWGDQFIPNGRGTLLVHIIPRE